MYASLPYEKHRPIKPATLFIGVGAVLLILFLTNLAAIAYLNYDHLNVGQVIVAEKWNLLSDTEGGLDYLILGDSSANSGFDPVIVQTDLNLNGLNLATTGLFGFVDDLWMLETYIKQHGAPEFVIVANSYDIGHRDVPVQELLGTYNIPISTLLTYTEIGETLSDFDVMQIYQNRLFPLYYRRDTLALVVSQFFEKGLDAFKPQAIYNSYGYMANDINEDMNLAAEIEAVKQQIANEEIAPEFSTMNQETLVDMIELAETHDFLLYIIYGPSYVGFDNDEIIQRYRNRHDRAFYDLVEGSSHAFYVEPPFSLEAEQMTSIDHNVGTASAEYTRAVMDVILIDGCDLDAGIRECLADIGR